MSMVKTLSIAIKTHVNFYYYYGQEIVDFEGIDT